MFFAQKIYFNNKPLILTNSATQCLKEYPVSAGYLFLKGAFARNLRLAQSHLKNIGSLGVLLEDIDVAAFEVLLQEFFIPITAAGGVVTAPGNKTLMIYRRGKWDLPKGKLDEGEDIQECALREVIEETGLREKIELGPEIGKTYHVYIHESIQIFKTTYWFEMKVSKECPLVPQKEENILEAAWIKEKDLSACVRRSWNAVKEVLEQAGKKIEA